MCARSALIIATHTLCLCVPTWPSRVFGFCRSHERQITYYNNSIKALERRNLELATQFQAQLIPRVTYLLQNAQIEQEAAQLKLLKPEIMQMKEATQR
jgi:hypothetical protein